MVGSGARPCRALRRASHLYLHRAHWRHRRLALDPRRQSREGLAVEAAVAAIAIGVVSNTVLKLTIAVTIGRGTFRWYVAAGLAAVAAALVAALRLTHGL